jgi:CubicO group peptidase (beta-lactamase class C family)
MNESALPRTTAYVLGEIEAGVLMTGAQVCVVDPRGDVHNVAAGYAATDVDASTIFRIWCASKPFTAIAAAKLVENGLLDLDAPLAGLLPEVRSLESSATPRAITLRQLLNHTAGLHVVTAPQMELLPSSERTAVMTQRNWVPDGWRAGQDCAYSEVLSWALLGMLVERATGEPLREHLRASVLDALGLERTWIGMSHRDYESNAPTIGINYDFRQLKAYPVLFERSERLCCETNCSYGGYTTATDLARFYATLLTCLRGEPSAVLPSPATLRQFCTTDRRAAWDHTFERECAFGLGFMTELSGHHFGPQVSPDAFGHSGWAGSSFAFADPQAGLVAAVITNGLLPPAAGHLSRLTLIEHIYEDCGLAPAVSRAARDRGNA